MTEKLLSIEEDVDDKANLLIERIHHEIKLIKDQQIEEYRKELQNEIESYKQNELDDLATKTKTEISQTRLKTKRKLLELRSSLVSDIYEEAKSKIIEFVESDNYFEYLDSKLDLVDLKNEDAVILVNKKDLKVIKSLLAKKSSDLMVKVSSFKFGGFIYQSKKDAFLADYTLDTKFEEAKDWFIANSGFII